MTRSNRRTQTYLTSPSSSKPSCPPLPFHPSLRLVHGPRSDGLRLALLHDPLTLLVLVLCGEPPSDVKDANDERLKLGSRVDDMDAGSHDDGGPVQSRSVGCCVYGKGDTRLRIAHSPTTPPRASRTANIRLSTGRCRPRAERSSSKPHISLSQPTIYHVLLRLRSGSSSPP